MKEIPILFSTPMVQAMDAINDSMQVVETKAYLRVYERDEKTKGYKPVPLALSAV